MEEVFAELGFQGCYGENCVVKDFGVDRRQHKQAMAIVKKPICIKSQTHGRRDAGLNWWLALLGVPGRGETLFTKRRASPNINFCILDARVTSILLDNIGYWKAALAALSGNRVV